MLSATRKQAFATSTSSKDRTLQRSSQDAIRNGMSHHPFVQQLGDDLLVGPSGKVIEKIDHGRALRVLARVLSNRHRRRSTRMSGRRGTVSTLPRPSCPLAACLQNAAKCGFRSATHGSRLTQAGQPASPVPQRLKFTGFLERPGFPFAVRHRESG